MITLTENAKNYLSSVAKDDFVTLGVNEFIPNPNITGINTT